MYGIGIAAWAITVTECYTWILYLHVITGRVMVDVATTDTLSCVYV